MNPGAVLLYHTIGTLASTVQHDPHHLQEEQFMRKLLAALAFFGVIIVAGACSPATAAARQIVLRDHVSR